MAGPHPTPSPPAEAQPPAPVAPASAPAPAPASAPDWRRLRLWQIQPLRDALIVVAIVGLVYLGYVLSIVTVPILLALLLAYLFEPLIRGATRRFRWVSRQGMAMGIICGAAIVIVVPAIVGVAFAVVQGASVAGQIAGAASGLAQSVRAKTPEERAAAERMLPPAVRWASERVNTLRSEVEVYEQWKRRDPPTPQPGTDDVPPDSLPPITKVDEWKVDLSRAIDYSINWLQRNAEDIAASVGKGAIGTGADAIALVAGTVVSLGFLIFTGFLTAFFFYFFSTGWGKVMDFWEGLIPERKKSRVLDLVWKMDSVVAGFVRGRLTICVILGVYMTVAYVLIGVPGGLILGPVVGVLFLVPYLSGIASPVAMLLMATDTSADGFRSEWWWIIFAPILVYVGAQMLDDYVLSPLIQGKTTNMDAPTILFASIAGGALAGVYGLLLAIPVAACLKILLKEVFWPQFRAWGQGKERDPLPISRE